MLKAFAKIVVNAILNILQFTFVRCMRGLKCYFTINL